MRICPSVAHEIEETFGGRRRLDRGSYRRPKFVGVSKNVGSMVEYLVNPPGK
jgi:hypothetical protein